MHADTEPNRPDAGRFLLLPAGVLRVRLPPVPSQKGKRSFVMVADNSNDVEYMGDSDLCKAVNLLETNGFYVAHAETENYKCGEHGGSGYTGAVLLRVYPKRLVKKIIPF
jgi:hypothetical protein